MGSRGPTANAMVVAAAMRFNEATDRGAPIKAKDAMISAGWSFADAANASKQKNVRKQAQAMKQRAARNVLVPAAATVPLPQAASPQPPPPHPQDALPRPLPPPPPPPPTRKRPRTSSSSTSSSMSSSSRKQSAGPIRNGQKAPVPYRRSSKQVVQQQAADNQLQHTYDTAFAEATTIWAEEKKKPDGKTSGQICKEMEEVYGVQIPSSSLRDRVNKGKEGLPNDRRGPVGKFPKEVCESICELIATSIALRQGSTKADLDAPEIKKLLLQLIKGSVAEGSNIDALYIRIRSVIAEYVDAGQTSQNELRRMLWTTDTNLDTWFDKWRDTLIKLDFATDEPELDADGNQVSEITISEEQKRRIINLDESRITTDGTADCPGGRPAHCLVVKHLPSTGTAANKSGDGGTFIGGSNAASEPLPGHVEWKTGAQSVDTMRINSEWVNGMPRVTVQFGHDEPKSFPFTFGMNESGGMNSEELWKYIKTNILPLYPDAADVPGKRVIIKIDGGPGRLCFVMLIRLRIIGIYLFPGVPNTTQVSQETDQNYGPFKTSMRRNLQVLANELFSDPDCPKSIGRVFWSVLIHGREASEGRPALPSPYALAFSKEANQKAWEKIGAVPLTRKCASHPSVRREIECTSQVYTEGEAEVSVLTRDPAEWDISLVEARNHACVVFLTEAGYKADVFKATAPRRPSVRPGESTEAGTEERIRAIAAGGINHGSLWTHTGGCTLNGDDIIRAQELRDREAEVVAVDAEKAARLKKWRLQEGAEEVRALGIDDKNLNGQQLNALIKHRMQKGFSETLKLSVPQRRQKWINEIKDLPSPDRVEDPNENGGDDEEELVQIPTLEETQLGRERERIRHEAEATLQATDNIDHAQRMLALAQAAVDRLNANNSANNGDNVEGG